MPSTLVIQPVVHYDVAALVRQNAGGIEAEIVGVRPAAGCNQHMACLDRRLAGAACIDGNSRIAVLYECDTICTECEPQYLPPPRISAIASEISSSSREVKSRPAFDDGDFGAEAAVHLREFETDIAAADDGEVAWAASSRWMIDVLVR